MDKGLLMAALAATVQTLEVEGVGAVRFRQISVREADALRTQANADGSSASEFGLQLLTRSLVNDDGTPILGDADLPALRDASSTRVEALIRGALQANGFAVGGAPGNL